MLGWIKLKKEPTDVVEAQPFALRCGCGAAHTGQRGEKHQQIRCHACDALLFVLPSNPYPTPKAPAPKPARKKTEAAVVKGSGSQPVVEVPRRVSLSERWTTEWMPAIRRELSILRLIVAGVVLLAFFTGAYLWRRADIEQARSVIDVAMEEGMKHFAAGNFVEAEQPLETVRRSIPKLGRNDFKSRVALQAAWENRAIQFAAGVRWNEVAATIVDAKPGTSVDVLSQEASKYFLFDAILRSEPGANGKEFLFLDLPLGTTERTLRLKTPSKGISKHFSRLKPEDTAAIPVILAGRIEPRVLSVENSTITLSFAPDLFLWCNLPPLQQIGMLSRSEEDVRQTTQILNEQRISLELMEP